MVRSGEDEDASRRESVGEVRSVLEEKKGIPMRVCPVRPRQGEATWDVIMGAGRPSEHRGAAFEPWEGCGLVRMSKQLFCRC